jgi:hypothetical protein
MQLIPTATDAIYFDLISWDSPLLLSSLILLGSLQVCIVALGAGRVGGRGGVGVGGGVGENNIYLLTLTRRRLFRFFRYTF